MIVYDGEYSVFIHMEMTEDEALEKGGINLEEVKDNAVSLTDWILDCIAENIEFNDRDTLVVLPCKQSLMVNGDEIELFDEDELGENELNEDESVESDISNESTDSDNNIN